MSSEAIDYKAVIADLKARRAQLDFAIATLEQQMLGASESAPVDLPVGFGTSTPDQRAESTEIRADTFFGLSIPDAIRKCFRISKRPLSLSDVTTSLKAGGLLTSAQNLMATVSATLQRMKKTDGDVVSLGKGQWGLTEWYPGLRKDKIEATAKPKKSRKRSKVKLSKTKAMKDEAQPESSKSAPTTAKPKPTPEQIEKMRILRAAGKKDGEIGKEFGIGALDVFRALKAKKAA